MSVRDTFFTYGEAGGLTPVPLPHWPQLDGKVFVRQMSAAEGRALWSDDDDDLQAARNVAVLAVDADGQRLFTDADAARLAACNFALIAAVNRAAITANMPPAASDENPTRPPKSESPTDSAS